ncbi:MAG: hypothetical protein DI582_07265 [Azospirillum brasilense]|nr:MAG: hypothetical protein DI582_07265 [Azospirillum brasilense]
MAAMRFFSNYPGTDLAEMAAQLLHATVPAEQWARTVMFVPTRRATLTLRDAIRRQAEGRTLLLPRIFSLADIGAELLGLLGPAALPAITAIAPAMPNAVRHYLLTLQVMRFEEQRGGRASLEHAMQLADYLADLQDRCTRAQVALTPETLQQLFPGDYAEHWQQSLAFLNIVGEQWPLIESVHEQVTQAAHEVQVLQTLSAAWQHTPPDYPVIAVGSTGSQPATAQLLGTIAGLLQGAVILPGLDPRMQAQAWAQITPAHPYFHIKNLLESTGTALGEVTALGEGGAHCSIWLEALCRIEAMQEWKQRPVAPQAYAHVRIVPCQHAEEEARSIALILREGLETPGEGRIALITPDESLMARVDAHLAQYGLQANRSSHGTLAQSAAGSVLVALLACMEAPESSRALVALLRNPAVQLGRDVTAWRGWLDAFDHAVRGVPTHRVGSLPHVPALLRESDAYRQLAPFMARVAELARTSHTPSAWATHLQELLAQLQPAAVPGHEALGDALAGLEAADMLGSIDSYAMEALLQRALEAPWRGPQFAAHPRLFMLTPVEARLQCFARVVLGNMQERVWPGLYGQSPWMNLAQQQQLGLPGAEEHAALMAHDVLVQASAGEVFLTYPEREGGSPVARSRYIERLVTLLSASGAGKDACITHHYQKLAMALHASARFEPNEPPRPTPAQRPARLRVSALDKLFTDPFSIYAEAVLGLRALNELDAEPEARDFGTLAHKAIQQLAEYWTAHGQSPSPEQISAWAAQVLAPYDARPAVQLFWRRRLIAALQFVNAQEVQRRAAGLQVMSERPIEGAVALAADTALQLHGRMDRLEQAGDSITVVDYKTGKAPTLAEMQDGRAVQLLAYAWLLGEQGTPPSALEYWGLPSGKRAGQIVQLPWDAAMQETLITPLKHAMAQLMDPATPLLARPHAQAERFENDFDGISRYDEWAG